MPDEIYHHLLRAAVAEGNLFRVKRFITRSKVPLRCPNPENGWPILFYAIRYNQNDIVNFLLDSGHDEREISKDFTNTTALMIAATHKNEKAFMSYLKRYPKTIHLSNDDGKTALIMATERGLSEIVQVLLDMGAEVNSADGTGSTPLHHAAAWGYFDLINLLMERGALYNIKNARGWTPFDWAFSVEIRDHLQECATALTEKKPIPVHGQNTTNHHHHSSLTNSQLLTKSPSSLSRSPSSLPSANAILLATGGMSNVPPLPTIQGNLGSGRIDMRI